MATPTKKTDELAELRSRLEWVDEERRKSSRRLAELEKRLSAQDKVLDNREQRVKRLEERVAQLTSQLARLPQVDTQLDQFKDEVTSLIEQYDERRVRSEEEMERLRRVEHEVNARELADVKKELPAIGRLQNEMELRQAEEARLANLIGLVQNRISPLENRVESWSSELAYLEEAENQNSRHINDIHAQLVEINQRWEPMHNRMDGLADKLGKLESSLNAIVDAQTDLRQSIKSWSEQIQLGEYERTQRMLNWERALDEHEESMKAYAQQWVRFTDQYKEAKMAVQTLTEWQSQIEQQQREVSEMARVEANRMQSRWDNFVTEHNKRWKTFEVDVDQRVASSMRHERRLREQIDTLDEHLRNLKQDLEKSWRVQSAQADAIKQFPRIWQEEIEKTLASDPNRRRQPALVPVTDEEL